MQQVTKRLLVVVIIILLSINTACTFNKNESPAPPAPKTVIKPGGQLRYGSLQEPNTLNPLMSDLLATAEFGKLIFSGLVTTNDKGEWIPDLAMEVPAVANGGVSSDGLTVTYRLKQGVAWHDGIPFTAEDVTYTWQFIMNRQANVMSREGYDKIVTVDVPNPYTAVVKFREYYAPFLTLFATILPKHKLENAVDMNKAPFNREPVGTGPFKFKEWRYGEALFLDANTSYFRGKPNLDGIIFKVIPDSTMAISQLKANEVDIVSNVNFAQYEQVKAIPGVRTVTTPTMVWEHFDFNLDNALFQDIQVRKAVALAIDRQAIVTNVFKGMAVPAVGDQSPLSWAYNPTQYSAARSINGAKELLIKAGWQLGPDEIFAREGRKLSFSLAIPAGNKEREQVAAAIAAQLKEAGILAEVRPIDAPAFFSDVLKNRRFETALFGWVAGLDPDNLDLWHSRKIPFAGNNYEGQNYAGWRNPEVDKLTDQGAKIVDVGARKEIYFRIQDLIREEVPVIPLYFHVNIDAVQETVANYQPGPSPAGSLWNAWQWGFVSSQ
ncbi:MAG TPA: peptide ABC transporter substrate-binding protein [Methylomusa anaerophila]|uniref:Oligopeptide-binding protein AppA n=1 Tax=Methylomusa anaerophila TaxID=1930071 RepID=A0A348AQN9_9FIRM|nr:peptide ABC transporter substrate-binding protein [Methylomusa anaerophila]BBB93387.1 oligopeptide-binding protein AppA precursor [Methylomusa anaerophila]HML90335.1 peptide ABC transporter substrate-binding protein [Methylomusa anaerophila]